MKTIKKILAVILAMTFICLCFAGCSSSKDEKYSDTSLIIGYTDTIAPILEASEDGSVSGFEVDLLDKIFDDVKGDYKSYTFEKIDENYALEEDGGFFDEDGNEYSAELLMGAVSKNNGTFNEDYSFTEPVISDRIIAVVPTDSKINTYADFKGAKAVVVSDVAKTAFEDANAISSVCKSITTASTIDEAFELVDSKKADVIVTDEFNFMPSDKADSYKVLDGEVDTIEYVIACAKYSGWKDTLNEAIRELKSEQYNDGDEFTPLVEEYFGYNASSFNYTTQGDD
jgi:ABC-type amino acid transport substrate-binding protein